MSLVNEGNIGDNHNRVSVSDADTVLSFSRSWDVQVQEAVDEQHSPSISCRTTSGSRKLIRLAVLLL